MGRAFRAKDATSIKSLVDENATVHWDTDAPFYVVNLPARIVHGQCTSALITPSGIRHMDAVMLLGGDGVPSNTPSTIVVSGHYYASRVSRSGRLRRWLRRWRRQRRRHRCCTTHSWPLIAQLPRLFFLGARDLDERGPTVFKRPMPKKSSM